MSPTTSSTAVRTFLLEHIPRHPRDVVALACRRFDLSRQAVHRHVSKLVDEGLVVAEGRTRARSYRLAVVDSLAVERPLEGLEEDALWRSEILPLLSALPRNVVSIWHYGFTEMVNNAVDHSEGTSVRVLLETTALVTSIRLQDDGVGIVRKIRREMGLEDERHALLELAKGKLTTDPARHTGEGIFFASRMLDVFSLRSGKVDFVHRISEGQGWLLEIEGEEPGTTVRMSLRNDSARTMQAVFDEYSSPDSDYGFTRTVVPVRLARYGQEQLISRSQAKRLMARLDRFRTVVLDFEGVDSIGQGFADEVFRVFVNQHPETILHVANGSPDIRRMIQRSRSSGV